MSEKHRTKYDRRSTGPSATAVGMLTGTPTPQPAAVDVRPEMGEHPPVPMTITIGDRVIAGTLTGIRRPKKDPTE